MTHEEVLAVLRPGGPVVDDLVKLLARLASQGQVGPTNAETTTPVSGAVTVAPPIGQELERLFLMTPVTDDEKETADEVIRKLLDQGWYVFGDRTPGRKRLKAGDHLCFYRTGTGVVAEA